MTTCYEVSELLLEFTSGELESQRREHVEDHLRTCSSCHAYLESYRLTIQMAGELHRTSLPPELASQLLALLQEGRRAHPHESAPGE